MMLDRNVAANLLEIRV